MIVFTDLNTLYDIKNMEEPKDTMYWNFDTFDRDLPQIELPVMELANMKLPENADRVEYLFDQLYNTLPQVYAEIFGKIMYPYYCGKDVILACDINMEYNAPSFMKALPDDGNIFIDGVMRFLANRYDCRPCRINSIDDYYALNRYDTSMGIFGVRQFDIDKERYVNVLSSLGYMIPTRSSGDPLLELVGGVE